MLSGTRFSEAYAGEDVTHFVVHSQVLSGREMGQLGRYAQRPLVVHDQWLLACFVAKARIEPDLYAVDPDAIMKASESQITTVAHLQNQPQSRSVWATKRTTSQSVAGTLGDSATIPAATNWIVPHRKNFLDSAGPGLTRNTDTLGTQKTQLPLTEVQVFLHPRIREQFGDRVVSLGGTLTDSSADYAVLPFVTAESELATIPSCRHHVNELWLLKCHVDRRIVPLDNIHQQLRPLTASRAVDREAFRALNICPTGFEPPERDYLASLLTRGLGGSFSEALSKRNTHLLCKDGKDDTRNGPKLEFASKTGIQCVTERWLLDSARAGSPLPVEAYVVAKPTESESSSTEATPQPPAKRGCGPALTSSRLPSLPTSLPAVAVDTPLRRDFNRAIKQAASALLPEEPTSAPGHSAYGPTQAIAREQLATLLHGLVFSISQRLWHRREELYTTVTDLGGTFLWSYDAACTHYLHQGNKPDESFREFVLARHCGKKIVSPHWLAKCKEEGRRLTEAEYPHHYNSDGTHFQIESVPPQKENVVPVTVSAAAKCTVRRHSIAVEPVTVPETYAASLEASFIKPRQARIVTYAGLDDAKDGQDGFPYPDACLPAQPQDRPSSTEGLSQNTRKLSIADPPRPRVIMFSGVSGPEKNSLVKQCTSLGETTVCDQNEW